jgi:hypothetical protein
MPRARTSKFHPPPAPLHAHAGPAVLAAGQADFAPGLGVYTIFFDIPRFEVVYFRLVIESWEDGAVARTMEPVREGDRTRTLVVALVVPDFLEPCLRRLGRLCSEIDGVQVSSTQELHEALRVDLSARPESD